MTEPATIEPEDATRSSSPVRTAITAFVGIVLAAILLLAVLRVFIPTIPPEQTRPEGHAGKPCVACHLVVDGAEEVEVE